MSQVLFLNLSRLCSAGLWREYNMKGVAVPGFEIEGNVVWGASS